MITADEILACLEREFVLTPAVEPRGSAPAEQFLVDGGPGTVGMIASVTRPFCGDCDRVRLTADGQVRNCLFAREESDLRTALRGGADDAELAERWGVAMRGKLAGHGIDDPSFLQPSALDVGHRRLAQPAAPGTWATTSLRKLRAPRNCDSDSRCSSHASQTLRRSGVWSLGLFHSSCHVAGFLQPLAEQRSGSTSGLELGVLAARGPGRARGG